ncbi:MAG: cob(I)yrinic acid a,c-diamide adenosyltransferase [Maioricimonas sp. JB049]
MVHLNRIYTRAGDDGQTHLGNMQRVPKTSLRIDAYGGVDELNSVLGVAACEKLPAKIASQLLHIQNDLFDVGADLCVPESETPPDVQPLRVLPGQVEHLERWIDEHNEPLEPLRSFVLPGGHPAAAKLHHARAVCRRVEIGVLRLADEEPVNRQVIIYLNRLSDLLFVMARVCNDHGQRDVLWTPGKHRSGNAGAAE